MRGVVLVVTLAALAAVGGASACGDSTDPIDEGDVVGEWSGTTSQGRPVAFTVSEDGVTDAQFGYSMSRSCTFTDVFSITAPDPLEVEDARFSTGKTQVGQAVFVTIHGEFTSSSRATGTMLIQHAPCSDTLNLTWSATKN